MLPEMYETQKVQCKDPFTGMTVIGNNPKEYGPIQVRRLVLEHVNGVREALAIGEGKLPKLPKGIPSNSRHCVIARALSNGWSPVVAGMSISLSHPNDGTVDFEAVSEALTTLGFRDVQLSRKGLKNRSVAFSPSYPMEQLIEEFDSNEFPGLILSKSEQRKIDPYA